MKLPDSYNEHLLLWKAADMSPETIAKKLAAEHGINVSTSAVYKRLEKLKRERAEAVGAQVLVKLQGTVTTDLDHLDGIIRRALEDELAARRLAWNLDKDDKPIQYDEDSVGQQRTPVMAGSEMWSRLMVVVRGSRSDLMAALEKRLELAGAEANKGKPVEKDAKEKLLNRLDALLEQASQKIPTKSVSEVVPTTPTIQ